jgi:stress-induced morphogen
MNRALLTKSSVNIVSEEFKTKMQPARHRMIYTLLSDELKQEGGIHALQLRTKTPEEEAKQSQRLAATSS